jgi:hypothetical protein
MKLTAKQLRQIISEEAGRLDEMFTPAGGIGFGDIPRPGRRSYLDLPIMGETDEVDEGGPIPVMGASLEDRVEALEQVVEKLRKEKWGSRGETS